MSKVEQSSVEFDRYQRIWQKWCRDYKQYLRWGQYLCNSLNITEEQAPGLYNVKTVAEANAIFNAHFRLD